MNHDNFVPMINKALNSQADTFETASQKMLQRIVQCCTKSINLDVNTTISICFICETPIRNLSDMPLHYKQEHRELLPIDVFGAVLYGYECRLCNSVSTSREQLAKHFESESHLRSLNSTSAEKLEERMEARTNARLNREWLRKHILLNSYGRVRNYKFVQTKDEQKRRLFGQSEYEVGFSVTQEPKLSCLKRKIVEETSSSSVSKLSHSFSLTMLHSEYSSE